MAMDGSNRIAYILGPWSISNSGESTPSNFSLFFSSTFPKSFFPCCHHDCIVSVNFNVPMQHNSTAWCSEIGSLTTLYAPEFHASSDVREPISLHQAVLPNLPVFSKPYRSLHFKSLNHPSSHVVVISC